MHRTLHLAAYDVRDPKRLARTCKYFKSWRVAGQKSVPELWLTDSELKNMRDELLDIIDPADDRIHIISLDPRMRVHCLGLATTFAQNHFCIL